MSTHDQFNPNTIRPGWISAVVLGVTLALMANACEGDTLARQPEGSIGYFRDMPPVAGTERLPWGEVGLTGSAPLRIAQDTLSAADHEMQEGFFSVGKLTISVPPNSIPADILREHRGAVVKLTIERVETPSLEKVNR